MTENDHMAMMLPERIASLKEKLNDYERDVKNNRDGYDDDLRNRSSKSPTKTPKENPMAVLKSALAQSLMPDKNGADMLKKQMATLDALFDHVVDDYTNRQYGVGGYDQTERLDFILRLQSRCASTARTLSAMDYMTSLQVPAAPVISDLNAATAPHPPQNDEQTEGM
jgi:hypothetical protein